MQSFGDDELVYELKIKRFDDVDTVEEMRVREMFWNWKSGQTLKYPSYAFDCESKLKIVED